MTARARNLSLAIAGALAFGLILGFVTSRSFGGNAILERVSQATGLALDAEQIDRDGDAFVLSGVSARSRGGALLAFAANARFQPRGAGFAVALEGARFFLTPERYRGDELRGLANEGGAFDLTLRDAAVTIVSGGVPEPLATVDGIGGRAAIGPDGFTYDLSGNLALDVARYPFAAHTETDPAGTATQVWSCDALPVAALAPFAAGAFLRPQGGYLRDVRVRVGAAATTATAQLDDVAFALGEHALDGIGGSVAFAGDGIGSRTIVGRLDGSVPFEAAGEVHDLAPVLWLRDGSNDLRALGRLIDVIAREPQLRSVRVEATAPGLAFAQYGLATDHGPLAISVLSIDPNEPTLHFDTALAGNHIISGGERTSAMGLRTGAVAGVNGDYFDIGRTYQPQGVLVKSGALLRGPTDRAALAIDRKNNVTFGEFHIHGSLRTPHGTMPITEFNDWPPGFVSVITPDYGKALRGVGSAAFVALAPAGGPSRYRVTKVVRPGGDPAITFGVAIGTRVRVPLPNVGDLVDLSYALDPPLGEGAAAIGGGPVLLRDGAWYEDPHAPAPDERNYRWPVVALARQADGRLMLVAVDGRHPERSVGATRPEFAAILQRLGAVDAMALDSGGSVTLVSRAPGDANVSVRNVPSDNSAERWISDGLFLYSSAPPPSIVPVLAAPTPLPEARPSP
jgi:exopolysaccharide biosynthesis protein